MGARADFAIVIVGLTGEGQGSYREVMKAVGWCLVLASLMSLTSCGLLRSAVQLPVRTLGTIGRTVGLGLEHSEVIEEGKEALPASPKAEWQAEE